MAVFGFQLCLTLIAATVLQKIFPIFSLGRWILCSGSLFRFLHPSNEELKKLAGKDGGDKRVNRKESKSAAKKRKQADKVAEKPDTEVFKIPKGADIILSSVGITSMDVTLLKKYDEFEWLINYSLGAIIVYGITEFYFEWWRPGLVFNLSMVWAVLALGFVCKSLFGIMRLYYKTESGELATSLTFGCFSFVVAMGMLAVNEEILDFGIDSAYEAFAKNSTLLSFNSVYPTPAPNPISLPVLKVLIALTGGIMATLLAFPGIRTAQMYVDGLKYAKKNQVVSLLLHINFLTPLVICMMWIKPITRDVLCSAQIYGAGSKKPYLTDDQFDIFRIVCILLLCFLKLAAIRPHLQAYLNLGYVKLQRIRKEAGHMTNVEVQKTVAQVFFYLCVVAVQYVGPILAVFFLTLCMKSMGGHSWMQISTGYTQNITQTSFEHPTLNIISEDSSFTEILSNAHVSLARLSAVFTPSLFRSIFSFFIWWLCTVWFIASAIGIVYHRYLTII